MPTTEMVAIIANPQIGWGYRPLDGDAPILVVDLGERLSGLSAANTVQVDWRSGRDVALRLRRINNPQHLLELYAPLSTACDGLTTSLELEDELRAKSCVDLLGAIPVALFEKAGDEWIFYSQSGFFEGKSVFLRTSSSENVDDPVREALERHHSYAKRVNNPEWTYQRAFLGEEVEVKFTFSSTINIHSEAIGALRAIRRGQLLGFIEHPVKSFWPSERRSRMFEIRGPANQRGYISYTDTSVASTYIEKVKRFEQDALVRHEQVTKGVAVPSEQFSDTARERHGLDTVELGVFTRNRYDIDFESLKTGNVFGLMFDHCVIEDIPSQTLLQCEVEYLESRTLTEPEESVILNELNDIVSWLREHFASRHLEFDVGYYSKLSFLRDALNLTR